MQNPFYNIVPRKDESVVNESFIKKVSEKIKADVDNKKLVILEGGYGTGKTLYLWTIKERLKSSNEFIKLSDNITNILKNKTPVKNKTLVIDNFDLTIGFKDNELYKLSSELSRLIKAGMIIVIAARRDVVRKLLRTNPLLRPSVNKIKIPGLTFDEAKNLVINRLNESRPKELKSVKPFTEAELREIWRKAHGNPRTILMLCRFLYDQRMLMEI